MSVSSGGAGEDAAAGGQVDFIASAATALGGSVRGATAGGSVEAASACPSFVSGCWVSTGSPGELGTVAAHAGACFLPSPLVEGSVLDQSGSPFL